jgi:hypothetical protein
MWDVEGEGRQYVPLKRWWSPTEYLAFASQKLVLFIVTVVRTADPTKMLSSFHKKYIFALGISCMHCAAYMPQHFSASSVPRQGSG